MRRSVVSTVTATLLAASLLVSTACQTYTSVDLSPSLSGKNVRVSLSRAGAGDLASMLGAPADYVEGHLVSATDSVVVLQMTSLTRMNGVEDSWNGERVRIPAADISRVETSRISPTRSSILAIAIIGGAYLAGRSFLKGATEATPTAGQPPQAPK